MGRDTVTVNGLRCPLPSVRCTLYAVRCAETGEGVGGTAGTTSLTRR